RGKQMELPITITNPQTEVMIDVNALVDTGSTGSCINTNFVHRHGLTTTKFEEPIEVFNADGTNNEHGHILEYVRLPVTIGDHKEVLMLLVTQLG
ncbi:hypothetical protein JAAARDRAFT_87577, partial [Jaapia argillacea MUCL 33604]